MDLVSPSSKGKVIEKHTFLNTLCLPVNCERKFSTARTVTGFLISIFSKKESAFSVVAISQLIYWVNCLIKLCYSDEYVANWIFHNMVKCLEKSEIRLNFSGLNQYRESNKNKTLVFDPPSRLIFECWKIRLPVPSVSCLNKHPINIIYFFLKSNLTFSIQCLKSNTVINLNINFIIWFMYNIFTIKMIWEILFFCNCSLKSGSLKLAGMFCLRLREHYFRHKTHSNSKLDPYGNTESENVQHSEI